MSVKQNVYDFITGLGNIWKNKNGARGLFNKAVLWHLKEILLCIILTLLLAKVDQIKHFFSTFALGIKEHNGSYGWFNLVLLMNALMIGWLSFVFWHKPARFFIYHFRPWILRKIPRIRIDRELRKFDKFENYYKDSGTFWYVGMVAAMPFLISGTALSLSLLHNDPLSEVRLASPGVSKWLSEHTFSVFLIAAIVFFIIATLLKPGLEEEDATGEWKHEFLVKWKRIFYRNFFVLLALLVIFPYLVWECRSICTLWYNYCVLLLFTLLPPLFVLFALHSLSICLKVPVMRLKKEKKPEAEQPSNNFQQIFQVIRFVSYTFGILLFVAFSLCRITQMEWFGLWLFPFSTLLFVFIAYYQFIDFLRYNVPPRWFYTGVGVLAITLLSFRQNDHFRLKYNSKAPERIERITLEAFFLAWAKDRFHPETDSIAPYKVGLVAAEGGGSRSGAWTASVLARLDEGSNGRFREHCFAISSISGGSVGSAAMLSLWENTRKFGKSPGEIYSDGRADRYIHRVFERNYISTAISGFFFNDIIQQIPLINCLYSGKSRTDRHQDEENDAIYRALYDLFPQNCESLDPDFFKTTDFLSLYYHTSPGATPAPKTYLPLFFPNTCRVQDGRRGVLSPVELDKTRLKSPAGLPFVAAVDVIGRANKYSSSKDSTISFGEATSLSELFPFVNSNVFIDEKTGSFMDGGAYENLGLTTLSEIHAALNSICKSPDEAILAEMFPDSVGRERFRGFLNNMRFQMLLIFNVNNHGREEEINAESGSLQLLDPVTTLLKTPFSGHTDYIYHKTRIDLGERMFVDFPLLDATANGDKPVTVPDIVMSRWLSKFESGFITERSKACVRQKFPSGWDK